VAVIECQETGNRMLTRKVVSNKLVREYERTFDCFTDNKKDDGNIVLTDANIPQLNSNYIDPYGTVDAGAYCDSVSPTCDADDPFHWTIKAHYTTEIDSDAVQDQIDAADSQTSDKGGGDPLAKPTVINYSVRARSRVAEFDYSDPPKEFINSAGQPFEPAVEEEIYNLVMSIIKPQATADPAQMSLYQGACNNAPWGGYQTYQARLTSWTADQQNEQGVTYYLHKYEVEIQLPSWETQVLDQGRFEVVGGQESSTAVDRKGIIMHGQGRLDGAGAKLTPATAASVYIKFKRYPKRNFGELNIP
jgi:hypothetical protein